MIVSDRYTVKVPGDLADDLETLADQAITEARERARLYCTPAEWTATRIAGEVGDFEVTFRVVRRRHKRAKTPA
jgi:hypothetical protein